MVRGDFHTHTTASHDGGLHESHIHDALRERSLHVIGITDHDVIDPMTFDLAQQYGGHIIVGEEITTRDEQGKKVEIIGLFLKEAIPPGLSTVDTAHEIADQNGIVYIPHPFEARRKGISLAGLEDLHRRVGVDVIETFNGRSFQQQSGRVAARWAVAQGVAMASGSDAHGPWGWGRTYTPLSEFPNRENFTKILHVGDGGRDRVGLLGRSHPALNKLGKASLSVAQATHL